MCGGELAKIGKRLVMLGEGMMEGEGIGKKIKKTARKTVGKKNLKKVAGAMVLLVGKVKYFCFSTFPLTSFHLPNELLVDSQLVLGVRKM